MIKKTYKVAGMHCSSCASMIELDLEDANIAAKCDFANETLEVEFDEKEVKEDEVAKIVKQSGYTLLNPR